MKKLFKSKRINVLIVDALILLLALSASSICSFMIKNIPPCVFAKMGVLCPACGGTRCAKSFFSGDIAAAFGHNAFFTVLFFYLGALMVIINLYCLFDVKALRGVIKLISGYKTVIIAAVAFAVFGFVRAVLNF